VLGVMFIGVVIGGLLVCSRCAPWSPAIPGNS